MKVVNLLRHQIIVLIQDKIILTISKFQVKFEEIVYSWIRQVLLLKNNKFVYFYLYNKCFYCG